MVNCEHVWREISNYIDGDVDDSLRAAIDDHLRTCKRCTSVLEGTRNVVQLYSDERMMEVPVGFSGRLERRLARSRRAGSRGWSTWSAWLVPIAALIIFTGGLRWANSLTIARPLLSQHAQPGKDIPPDMVVVVSEGAKDFHVPGCSFIHDKDKERTLTAKQAMEEGYVPCVRCMRKYLHMADEGNASVESEADSDTEPAEAGERGRGH